MLEIFHNKRFSKIKKGSETLSLLVPEPVNPHSNKIPWLYYGTSQDEFESKLRGYQILGPWEKNRNASNMLFHPKMLRQRSCRADKSKHSAVLRAWLSSRQVLLTAEA